MYLWNCIYQLYADKYHLIFISPRFPQEQILAKEAEAARERRRKREAEATLQERLIMNSQHKEAKTALIEDEVKLLRSIRKTRK
jgi:hypothetical protein